MRSRAAVPRPSPCLLFAGRAGFYAGAHHGGVRGCTCAVSGGGAFTVALARSSRAALAPTLARTTVWCEAAPVQSRAAAPLPLPWLARRGLRWLLRWRAPQCGARLHLCRLRRRRLFRRLAHSSRAALASRLARTTVWCEAAPVQSRAAAPRPLFSSLVAGCAGSYAGAHHSVVRGCTCAVSGGDAFAAAPLARRGLRWLLRWRAPRCGARLHPCSLRRRRLGRRFARSSRSALASMLARTTVWCEAAPSQSRAAAPRPSPSSLVAGCAGFHAGAHHGVVRGCTRAASGGGASAVA